MPFLKGGLGVKVVLAFMGIVMGAGGVAAGAKFHAAFGRHFTFVGYVTAVNANGFTLHTRSGRIVTVVVSGSTKIVNRSGRSVAGNLIRQNTIVIVQGTFDKGTMQITAAHIQILRKRLDQHQWKKGP